MKTTFPLAARKPAVEPRRLAAVATKLQTADATGISGRKRLDHVPRTVAAAVVDEDELDLNIRAELSQDPVVELDDRFLLIFKRDHEADVDLAADHFIEVGVRHLGPVTTEASSHRLMAAVKKQLRLRLVVQQLDFHLGLQIKNSRSKHRTSLT